MSGLQKYPDPDLDFCYFCQDTRENVGHSNLNCPESKCKECGVSGHIVKNCPVLMHANDFRKLTQHTVSLQDFRSFSITLISLLHFSRRFFS